MTAPLPDRASAAVYRLAELVHREEPDEDTEAVLFDAVKVIVERDPQEFWTELLDAFEQRDSIEDRIAIQNRGAEVEIVNDDIARALWAVLHGTRLYCQRCIERLEGQPWEVAAKTPPQYGALRDGRKGCEKCCQADWWQGAMQ